MGKICILITMVLAGFQAHSQGTQVGDVNSPIYHYNGNVGIGITSPAEKLQVVGMIKADGIYNTGGIFNYENKTIRHYGLTLWADGHGYLSSYYGLTFFTSGLSRIEISQNGNVGIGTSTPFSGTNNYGLHVFKGNHSSLLLGDPVNQGHGGIIQTSDGRHRVYVGANLYDDQNSSWKSFQTGKGGAGISILADQNDWGTNISFYLSEQDNEIKNRMIIKGNGNVGIGNTNPSEKLVVDGKILAEEIKVQTVPASDYVFEPDYDLLPLNEVDQFIRKNKHLPDIPSAEEFKENGVGLGEMDDMLLKKIEELTLYVIEQNRKLEAQSMKLELLEKENEELK